METRIRDSYQVRGLVLNVPDWFDEPDFRAWLNDRSVPVMTWHERGTLPSEWSDTVVHVDGSLSGEGSDSEMPGWAWEAIVDACREHNLGQPAHTPVRLTNVNS